MSIKKWLHFEESIRYDYWAAAIQTKVREAVKRKKLEYLPLNSEDLAIHISIKLKIIHYTISRLNKSSETVIKDSQKHEGLHIFTSKDEGAAFKINDELKYLLISDIETYLFQVNTCWELMINYFILLNEHTRSLTDPQNNIELINSLHTSPKDYNWISLLDSRRSFIAHQGSTYLALDITNSKWEIVVLKKNVKKFNNPKTFFKYSELISINDGFNNTRDLMKKYLIDLYI